LKAIRENKNPELNDQHLINTLCHYDCKLFPPTYQLSYHNLLRYKDGPVWSIMKWNRYYGTNYSSIKELVMSSYMWHFHENKFEMARDYPKIKHILDSFMSDLKQFVITKKVLPWKPDDDSSFYIDFKEK
jgi:hypothetical protein